MHNLPFETLKQRTMFYFLRHGESEGNRAKKVQGHQDADLTETGRNQARKAGEYFVGKNISRIFSSPLSRALDTAKLVATTAGIDPADIQQRDNLIELNTGIFSGLTFEETQQQYPVEWEQFQQDSWEAVPGAERISELLQRASSVWQELIETANRGNPNLLCVSHGGTLQWIIKRSMSAEWSRWLPIIQTGNCGIHAMEVRPLGDEEHSGRYYAAWTRINHLS